MYEARESDMLYSSGINFCNYVGNTRASNFKIVVLRLRSLLSKYLALQTVMVGYISMSEVFHSTLFAIFLLEAKLTGHRTVRVVVVGSGGLL